MNLLNRKLKFLLIGQLFILTVFISTPMAVQSKTTSTNLTQPELDQKMRDADLVAIYDANASNDIQIDGVIGANEYPETFHSFYTGMNISIAHNNTQLFVGISAPTNGYAAVGFNALGYGMVGADIKAGWVYHNTTGSYTTANDYYATAYDYPARDPTIASTDKVSKSHNDVVEAFGIDHNGSNGGPVYLQLEMVINMVSANSSDLTVPLAGQASNPIYADRELDVNQTYSFLMAWGLDDGIVYHTRKEIASLFIAPPGVAPRTATNLVMTWTGNETGTKDTHFTANATLTDASDNPIPNATVGMYIQGLIADNLLVTAKTDANGIATFNFTFLMEYSSDPVLLTKYMGGMMYKRSASNSQSVSYTGSVVVEEAPFLIVPMDMDYIVPWLTGLAAVGTVAFMWVMFGYVIYTVLYKNAVQPDAKKMRPET